MPKVSLRIELTIRLCSKEIIFALGLFPHNITPFIMILHSGNTLYKLLAKLLKSLSTKQQTANSLLVILIFNTLSPITIVGDCQP